MNPNGVKRLMPILKIAVSAGLITVVLKRVGAKNFIDALKGINPLCLAGAILVMLFILILAAYRWRLCMLPQGIDISFGNALNYSLIGFFFNNFAPSTVGGDIVKGIIVGRFAKKGIGTAVSIIIDRLIGLLAMGVMALIALFISFNLQLDRRIRLSVILFVFLVMGFQYLVFHKGLAHRIAGILKSWHFEGFADKIGAISDSFYSYRAHTNFFKRAFIISFVMWTGNIFISFILARGLGIDLSFKYFIIIIPLILAIMSIPISFGGLGLRELAYVGLFGMVGVPEERAMAISVSYYMATLLLSFAGGVLLLKSK